MTLDELRALIPNEGTRGVQDEIAAFGDAANSTDFVRIHDTASKIGIDSLLRRVGAIQSVEGALNYHAGYIKRRAYYSHGTFTTRAEYTHALAQLPRGYKPHNPRSAAGDQPALEREIAAPITPRIWTRYRFDRAAGMVWQPCGVACRMKIPTMTREGQAYVRGKDAWYWEHGADVAECEAERARKTALKLEEIDRENERLRSIEAGYRQKRRDERRARLITRLCDRAIVTVADVRAVGACMVGIENWCAAHSVSTDASLPITVLATDLQAFPYALAIARRVRRTEVVA